MVRDLDRDSMVFGRVPDMADTSRVRLRYRDFKNQKLWELVQG